MLLKPQRFYRAASLSHAKTNGKAQNSRALFHIGITALRL